MPQFAANLSMLYTELPFLDRFEAAAADGFKAVEFLFPYAWPAVEIAARLRGNGLQQVLFNAPAGGVDATSSVQTWESGMRGTACLPGREAEFRQGVAMALAYAEALDCPRIHLLAGRAPADAPPDLLHITYVNNLRWAADQATRAGRRVLIEPINTRDMPGYFLNYQAQAHAILAEVGSPALQVQMDLYHCQIMEGDLLMRLQRHLAGVGHLQIAGVPHRHEPDTGEVNYRWLFDEIDALGYDGYIGCEYRPRGATSAGLGWFAPYKDVQS